MTTYTLIHFENGVQEASEYWQTPYGDVRIGSCSSPEWPAGMTEDQQLEAINALRNHPDSRID